MKPRTETDEIERQITAHLAVLRDALRPESDSDADVSLAAVETFVAVALRIIRKTPTWKVRDQAMTFEIKARLDGAVSAGGGL